VHRQAAALTDGRSVCCIKQAGATPASKRWATHASAHSSYHRTLDLTLRCRVPELFARVIKALCGSLCNLLTCVLANITTGYRLQVACRL
jgi:hypothetical protein